MTDLTMSCATRFFCCLLWIGLAACGGGLEASNSERLASPHSSANSTPIKGAVQRLAASAGAASAAASIGREKPLANPVAGNTVLNPGFEEVGTHWGGASGGGFEIMGAFVGVPANTGSRMAWLGGYNSGTDSLSQGFPVSGSGTQAKLQFWYNISTQETGSLAVDTLDVELFSLSSGAKLATLASYSNLDKTAGWVKSPQFDVSAFIGQNVQLRFIAKLDNVRVTSFLIDDVSVAMQDFNAVVPQDGWWWNPLEGGRGFAFERQGDQLFMAAFLYDESGAPTWYVATMTRQTNGAFQGDLLRYSGGQTLLGPYRSPTPANLGFTASLSFESPTSATLDVRSVAIGVSKAIAIERFGISTPAFQAPAVKFDSGWWWNEGQGGRGFYIEVQGNQAFIGAFMYDAQGKPIWYVSYANAATPELVRGGLQQYSGGQTLTGRYNSPTLTSNAVGSLSFVLTSANVGVMTLPDGSAVDVKRFAFNAGATGTPAQLTCGLDCVQTGYSGSYTDNGGDGGGGGDGSAGDGGQYRNTRVRVEMADGRILGEALTDELTGMVTMRGARTGKPVKITYFGSAAAQYFDEARNAFAPFALGDSVTVVVPFVDKNVGATPFTEAAYRWLVRKYGPNGWRVAANVIEANEAIQSEMRAFLRSSMSVADITRLSVVYRGANTSVIDVNQNSIYSLTNSGFAFAAGQFNTIAINPAALARQQLVADLTDGRIDGFTADGTLATAANGSLAYDTASLSQLWLQGANRVAAVAGTPAANQSVAQAVRLTTGNNFWKDPATNIESNCPRKLTEVYPAQYFQTSDGRVIAQFPRTCNRANELLTGLPGKVVNTWNGEFGDVFFGMEDGSLYVIGANLNGTHGVGNREASLVPRLVPGLRNVSKLWVSFTNVIAVKSDGTTWAWGFNYSLRNVPFWETKWNPLLVPEQVAGLPKALEAIAGLGEFLVLGEDGKVYYFGLWNQGLRGDGSAIGVTGRAQWTPAPVAGLNNIAMLTGVQNSVITNGANSSIAMALRRDGRVVAWGLNYENGTNDDHYTPEFKYLAYWDILGTGVPAPQMRHILTPQVVQGVPVGRVRQIGMSAVGAYAWLDDGTMLRWGRAQQARDTAPILVPQPTVRNDASSATARFTGLLRGLAGLSLTSDGQLYDFQYGVYIDSPIVGAASTSVRPGQLLMVAPVGRQ